jgi:ABC-type branched-subunit amino acid transport system substrate-binding protein
MSPDFKSFLSEFERSTGGAPRAPFNFKTNYNAVRVVYDGIMAVGPDSMKVKDYLYSYDKPSATGRLRFDAQGDVVGLELVLRTFGAGK